MTYKPALIEETKRGPHEGVWAPLYDLHDKKHAELMDDLEEYGGIFIGGVRDGEDGKPNKYFLSPWYRLQGCYIQSYGIGHWRRKEEPEKAGKWKTAYYPKGKTL